MRDLTVGKMPSWSLLAQLKAASKLNCCLTGKNWQATSLPRLKFTAARPGEISQRQNALLLWGEIQQLLFSASIEEKWRLLRKGQGNKTEENLFAGTSIFFQNEVWIYQETPNFLGLCHIISKVWYLWPQMIILNLSWSQKIPPGHKEQAEKGLTPRGIYEH